VEEVSGELTALHRGNMDMVISMKHMRGAMEYMESQSRATCGWILQDVEETSRHAFIW